MVPCYVELKSQIGSTIHHESVILLPDGVKHRDPWHGSVVDDDPQHLNLYRWVIERGPFTVIPLLVGGADWQLPEQRPDIVALNYRLKSPLTAVDIAKRLNAKYPKIAIVVLSELEWLPEDMVPYSVTFVSKGEPELLLTTLSRFRGFPLLPEASELHSSKRAARQA